MFWYCLVTGSGQKYTFLSMSKTNNHTNSIDTGVMAPQTEVSVYYSGVIDKQAISQLLMKVEKCIMSSQNASDSRNKIIAITIELLQNIYHHCAFNIDGDKDSPTFSLKKEKDLYILTTSNLMKKSSAPFLKQTITELNNYSKKESVNFYRDILNDGKLSDSSAGLGLMDIFRKSGNPIIANFNPKDNKYTQLTVIVSISLNNR